MKIFKAALMMLSLFAFVTIMAKSVGADSWDQKTTFTFHQPVEIPGGVLAAGTYVFRVDDNTMRNIVRIYDKDGRKVVATLMTANDEGGTWMEATVLEYHSGHAGSPRALRAWFYQGKKIGLEFLYPKTQAARLEAEGAVTVPILGS